MLGIAAISVLIHLLFPDYKFYSFYFWDLKDSFMDFYHSIRFGASENPYEFELIGAIYPPFCYLLYGFLARFLNPELFADPFVMRDEQNARMLMMVCSMVLVFLLITTIYGKLSAPKWQKNVIAGVLILSYPLLYLLERANILLLAALCLVYFVLNHDSEDKVQREISLVLLAVAAAIKIYPAAFGILLFFEEKVDCKKILRCIVYGVVLFFGPFFFYEGIPTILQFVENLQAGIGDTPIGFLAILLRVDVGAICYACFYIADKILSTGIPLETIETLAKIVSFVLTVVFMIGIFVKKETWKKVLMVCAITLVVPPFSYTYCLITLLCPFVALLKQKQIPLRDLPYLIYFPLLLVVSPLSKNWYQLLLLMALYGIMALDVLGSVLMWLLHKKQSKSETADA